MVDLWHQTLQEYDLSFSALHSSICNTSGYEMANFSSHVGSVVINCALKHWYTTIKDIFDLLPQRSGISSKYRRCQPLKVSIIEFCR